MSESENFTLTAETELPEAQRFRLPNESNSTEDMGLDFPVETVWKMVTFVHYHCHAYFNRTVMDLSYLQVQLERLFNDAIQYRW